MKRERERKKKRREKILEDGGRDNGETKRPRSLASWAIGHDGVSTSGTVVVVTALRVSLRLWLWLWLWF